MQKNYHLELHRDARKNIRIDGLYIKNNVSAPAMETVSIVDTLNFEL